MQHRTKISSLFEPLVKIIVCRLSNKPSSYYDLQSKPPRYSVNIFELLSCKNPLKMPSSDPTHVSTKYITILNFYFISECPIKLILIITFRADIMSTTKILLRQRRQSWLIIHTKHEKRRLVHWPATFNINVVYFQYQCCVLLFSTWTGELGYGLNKKILSS